MSSDKPGVMKDKIIVYVNGEQLKTLLKDELFIAYAPLWAGKITGGKYLRSNTFFQLKKSVKV